MKYFVPVKVGYVLKVMTINLQSLEEKSFPSADRYSLRTIKKLANLKNFQLILLFYCH